MLPNFIALTLRTLYSDFWRYIALGLIAIYVLLPMAATPLAFAAIVTGVTFGAWLVVSLFVWTAPYRCNIHIVNRTVVMVAV
jgi:hypothetical protein